MFHKSMRNHKPLALFSVLVGFGLFASCANAADALDEFARGHLTQQVGGFWYIVQLVCLVGGGIVCATALGICIALAFEKAPPQLQQVGYKGPVIAMICGGLLASLTWLLGFSAKTASGQDINNSTWQQLNGGSSSIISPDTNFNVASQLPLYYVPTV